MSSYLSPAVDHNLYNPVLPQTNVAEIFQLMGVKQQLYNQNLARINTNLSSMNDLSSQVTNDNVKNKIEEYNKVANENLKKYSNLDFSIADNVKAIDNIYTPLLQDQDFITDFSGTSHLNNQMKIGFAKRDSDKKEERDEFSMTNMQYVTDGFYDLKNAKNSKELKMAAGKVSNRYYVPYTDYGKELEDSLIKLNATVSYDQASGGYVVTTKNGATGKVYTQGIKKFLDLTLSDKAKQQINIESTVIVDSLIRSQGIEKLTTDYIQQSIDKTDDLRNEYLSKKETLMTKLNVLPSEEKMNKKQKDTYNTLQDQIEDFENNIALLDNKKLEISNINKKLQDGTFSYDDFANVLVSELSNDKINSLTSGLAQSYSETHAEYGLKEDTAYSHKQDLSFKYSELEQKKLEHRDDLLWKEKNLKLEYDKIEADLIKVGLKLNGSKDGIVPVEGAVTNDVVSSDSYNALVDLEIVNNRQTSTLAREEFVKIYKSLHNGQEPPKNSPLELQFANPNLKLDPKGWDQKYIDAKKKIFKQTGTSIDDKEVLQNYLRDAANEFNKTFKGAKIGFDKNGKIIDGFTGNVYSFRQKYDEAVKTNTPFNKMKFNSAEEAKAFINYAQSSEVVRQKIDKDPRILKTSGHKYIEDFNSWLTKPKEMGGYGKKLSIAVQSTLFTRGENSEALYKTIEPTTVSWLNSHPINETTAKELLKINPQYNGDWEALQAAYSEFYRSSKGDKFSPTMQAGSREKGTNFVVNNAKAEAKDSESVKTGLSTLSTKGINLPIEHPYYATVSKSKSLLESGKEVTIEGFNFYKDNYGDSKYPYKAYPKGDHHHYLYDGNYELVQTENGYEIKPLKSEIPITAQQMSLFYDNGISNLTSSIQENINKVESSLFEKKLNTYISTHPDAVKIEGGKPYVEPSVINSILKTIVIK